MYPSDHALQITQRHTSTTYSVAACVSRVANGEWLRSCEGVRRFASTVGQLGEWRALCEGGWTAPIPQDLPDIEDLDQEQPDRAPVNSKWPDDEDRPAPITMTNVNKREFIEQSNSEGRSPPGYGPNRQEQDYLASPMAASAHIRPDQSPSSGGQSYSPVTTGPSSFDPPRPRFTDDNTGSVRSLSAFPSPPTHYPIPPLATQRLHPSQSQSSHSSSSISHVSPAMPRLTESPLPEEDDVSADPSPSSRPPSDNPSSPDSDPSSTNQRFQDKVGEADIRKPALSTPSENEIRRPIPIRSQTVPVVESNYRENAASSGSGSGSPSTGTTYSRGDYIAGEREFGMDNSGGYSPTARTVDVVKSKNIERSDTGASNGSIVAAMRNRYSYRVSYFYPLYLAFTLFSSQQSGAISPVTKDVPRLPLSVTDLAFRYQPTDGPTSPHTRATSPPVSRQLPFPPLDTVAQARQAESSFQERSLPGAYNSMPTPGPSSSTSNVTPTPDDEAARRRRQQIEERVEVELHEKERELREREREIEMRARELERERAQLMDARGDEYPSDTSRGYTSPQPQLRPRERQTSFKLQQRPRSQLDLPSNSRSSPPADTRPQSRYSHSTTHLAPPPSSSQSPSQPSSSHSHSNYSKPRPPSPLHAHSQQQHEGASEHAPFCGCDTCSVAKYKERKAAPSPHDLRPPAKPIALRPEKPKGWMRRLSMPVGNAFSLDSKKNTTGLGSTMSGKGGMYSLDGKKNLSSTMLSARGGGVQEDGRLGGGGAEGRGGRRSYEASGISNRSATNLGMGGRR